MNRPTTGHGMETRPKDENLHQNGLKQLEKWKEPHHIYHWWNSSLLLSHLCIGVSWSWTSVLPALAWTVGSAATSSTNSSVCVRSALLESDARLTSAISTSMASCWCGRTSSSCSPTSFCAWMTSLRSSGTSATRSKGKKRGVSDEGWEKRCLNMGRWCAFKKPSLGSRALK